MAEHNYTIADLDRITGGSSKPSYAPYSPAAIYRELLEKRAVPQTAPALPRMAQTVQPKTPASSYAAASGAGRVAQPMPSAVPQPTFSQMVDSGLKTAGDWLNATNPLPKVFAAVDTMENLAIKSDREKQAAEQNYRQTRNPKALREYVGASFGVPQKNLIFNTDWAKRDIQMSPMAQVGQQNKVQSIANLKEGKGELGQRIVDIAAGAGELAGDVAITAATGIPIAALYGITGGAEAAQRALDEGYSANKALTAGTASGIITSQLERFGGVGGNLGAKYIGRFAGTNVGKAILSKAPKAVEYLGKVSTSKLGQIAGSALSESVEEFTEYDAQRITRNLLLDQDTPRDVKEQLNNAFVGGGIGALFGGVNVAAQRSSSEPANTHTKEEAPQVVNAFAPTYTSENGLASAFYNPTIPQEDVSINTQQKPVMVGKATVIKNPYSGEVPTYDPNTVHSTPAVTQSSVQTAREQIAVAQEKGSALGKSPRNFLTEFYNAVFEGDGGARGVQVNGVSYGNKSYVVTLNKNAIAKVVSDPNISPEKLSVFNVLDDVVENGEYVGSSSYEPKGEKKKGIIRYDYFETAATIEGNPYIVTFDVSVLPNQNNYRTHKVINNIDLTPLSSADTGPVPAAKDKTLGLSNPTIPQGNNGVNSQYTQDFGKNTVGAAQTRQSGTTEGVNSAVIQKISELSEKMGVTVVFEDRGIGNGRYENGTIYINKSSKTPIKDTFIHEFTHSLETSGAYNDFANVVMDSDVLYSTLEKEGVTLVEYKQNIKNQYAQSGIKLNDTDVNREIVAKFSEQYLSDEKTIARLADINPTIFTRIKNWIDDMLVRFKGTPEEKAIVKMRQLYDKAAKSGGTSTADVPQHSIQTDADGNKYVKVDTDILAGVPRADWVKTVKEFLKARFSDGIRFEGQKIGVNLTSRDEFTNSKYTQSLRDKGSQVYADKFRMSKNIDEVVKTAIPYAAEQPKHNRKDSIVSFERGTLLVRIGEHNYSAEVVIAQTSSGLKNLYDVVKITPRQIKEVTPSAYQQKMPSAQDDVTSNTNIAQANNGVNTQSMQKDKENTRYSLNPVEIGKLNEAQASTTPPLKSKPTAEGDKPSKFAGSVQKQTIFDEHFKQLASDDNTIQSYRGITNKETLQKANSDLNVGGEVYVTKWYGKSEDFSAQDIATGFILMDRYQAIGDYESMLVVAEKLRGMGTSAGQTVQALSIMGRMTPEGMALYAQNELSKAFKEMIQGKTKFWIDTNKDRFKLTDKDIEFIQRRTLQAAQLPHGRDKMILLGEISARIQEKIPPSPGNTLKSLARISMLLNPKTNARNILGNVTIAPQHIMSDFVGSAVDRAISAHTGVRTTGAFHVSALQGMKKGLFESYDDFRRKINTRDMGGDRFELGDGPSFANKTPIGRSLNTLDRVTSFLLDAGDRPFYETWFINSLNNQIRLNGTDYPTPAMIDIATTEALQRTWQDSNKYTDMVSRLRKDFNTINISGYGLGDVVMPFVKTPANLTKALVDFSPVGLGKAIALDARRFKNAVETGQATPQMQKQFVKSLSQGITGTLIFAILYGLADKGLIKGEGDKDKDVAAFMKNIMGEQPYSVKIGDKTYSYGWAQPLAGQAAIVADVVNTLKTGKPKQYIAGDDDTTVLVNAILSAIQSGGNVLYEQSFMQGIQNLFSQDNLVKGLMDSVLSEPSKFTPQFLSQIAQYQDPIVRTSYVYGQPIETALNKVKAKVPGLSQTLEPVVDVLGRDVKRSGGDNSAVNVFLNPANVAKENRTPAADEAYRLYKATGDKGVIPQTAPNYIEFGSTKHIMTPKQKTEYQRTTGGIASEELTSLAKSAQYKKMPVIDQAELVKDIYAYAAAVAKSKVSDYELDGTNKKVYDAEQQGVEAYQWYLIHAKADTNGNNRITQDEMSTALDSSGLSWEQRAYMWALENKGWKINPYK